MDDFKNIIDNLVRDGYTINTGSLSFSKQLNGSIVTVKIDKTPNGIYCDPIDSNKMEEKGINLADDVEENKDLPYRKIAEVPIEKIAYDIAKQKEESKQPKSNAIFFKGYLLRPKYTLNKILKEGLFFGHSNIMLKTRKPMKVAKKSVILSVDLGKYVEDYGSAVESKSKDSPVIYLHLDQYHIPAEYITVEEPEPKYQSIRTTALSDYFAKHPIGFYVGKAYNGLTMEDNSIDTPEEGRYIELSLSLPYVRTGATIYSVDLEAFVNNNPEADITVINPHDKKEATVLVREDIPAEYVRPGVEYPKYADDYLNTEPGKAIMKNLEKGSK